MDSYADVFDVRGHKYDAAMQAFPQARDQEFVQLFHGLDVSTARRVYDIPSGGGYLRRFLGKGAELVEYDPSQNFGRETAQAIDLEHLQLPRASVDLVVSLAALHHVVNKAGFFRAALQALRPGGWLCVGDVPSGSGVAHFRDEFVGGHHGTGHAGDYLAPGCSHYEKLSTEDIELVRCEVAACPWQFRDTDELARFCRSLFGLIEVSDKDLLDALDRLVGIEPAGDRVGLCWELLYLQFRVADTTKPLPADESVR